MTLIKAKSSSAAASTRRWMASVGEMSPWADKTRRPVLAFSLSSKMSVSMAGCFVIVVVGW